MADFPNRINELRRAFRSTTHPKGLSQDQLADALGTTKITISRLERGKMELTLTWMQRIARVLQCAAADLLPAEDAPDRLDEEEAAWVAFHRHADDDTRENLHRVAEALTGFRPEKRNAA